MRGTGTIVIGGTLVEPKIAPSGDAGGTGVSGGMTYQVKPGDMFLVAENEPHWFKSTGNGVMVAFTMHVPRPAAGWR